MQRRAALAAGVADAGATRDALQERAATLQREVEEAKESCKDIGDIEAIGDDAAETNYQSTDGTQVTTCSEIFADRGNAALIKNSHQHV